MTPDFLKVIKHYLDYQSLRCGCICLLSWNLAHNRRCLSSPRFQSIWPLHWLLWGTSSVWLPIIFLINSFACHKTKECYIQEIFGDAQKVYCTSLLTITLIYLTIYAQYYQHNSVLSLTSITCLMEFFLVFGFALFCFCETESTGSMAPGLALNTWIWAILLLLAPK